MGPTIVWFRRDLRLIDNPALDAAVRAGTPILPIYIFDETPALRAMGAASLWWLGKSLAELDKGLRACGSRLVLRRGHAADIILNIAKSTNASNVVFNAVFDPGYGDRDRDLSETLKLAGVATRRFNGAHLVNPSDVRTKTGGAFSVFTPFWHTARLGVSIEPSRPVPDKLDSPERWPSSDNLKDWQLQPSDPDWSLGFADWSPGEAGAAASLDTFLDNAIVAYSHHRDLPAVEGTSRLSPHLHFGEISPKACWRAALAAAERNQVPDSQVDKFLSELGWREFSTALVTRRGDMAMDNFDNRFDAFPWRNDPAGLKAWQRGNTGYPIVDAGMRQLWTTGWMHNRIRMVCASFLTKHLMIDWRQGERWFWDTLVDADHAANAANWQWVAGCGADAAPYFRIFNPILQGEKFDKDGAYVRRWVPELSGLPARYIHAPWSAPLAVLCDGGVDLGITYPEPIVDHGLARHRALEAYAQLRNLPPGADADA